MPETDPIRGPTEVIRVFLRENWDKTQTVLADPPEFITEQYERDMDAPAICFAEKSEGPINGGSTGINTTTGGNRLGGTVTVHAVAGTWDHVEGAGGNQYAAGSTVPPKVVRWSLYKHAAELLHAQRPSYLRTTSVTSGDDWIDHGDEDERPVYGTEFKVRYTRLRTGV